MAPRLVAFVKQVDTACGPLDGAAIAVYCGADNSIYYDAYYLAYMAKTAAFKAGTDGEYAPLVVIAHELGHAVQHQLRIDNELTIDGENTADCVAGALTREVASAGSLDAGNLREALVMLGSGSRSREYQTVEQVAREH
jgi:predicted metalloprotease